MTIEPSSQVLKFPCLRQIAREAVFEQLSARTAENYMHGSIKSVTFYWMFNRAINMQSGGYSLVWYSYDQIDWLTNQFFVDWWSSWQGRRILGELATGTSSLEYSSQYQANSPACGWSNCDPSPQYITVFIGLGVNIAGWDNSRYSRSDSCIIYAHLLHQRWISSFNIEIGHCLPIHTNG